MGEAIGSLILSSVSAFHIYLNRVDLFFISFLVQSKHHRLRSRDRLCMGRFSNLKNYAFIEHRTIDSG